MLTRPMAPGGVMIPLLLSSNNSNGVAPMPFSLPSMPSTTATLATVIGSFGFGAMFAKLLDYLRGRRQDEVSAAMALIDTLQSAQRRQDRRIDKLENLLAMKDQIYELKAGQLRHRLANMRTAFTGLMLLLRKATSESLPSIVEAVEQMRLKQEEEEAAEAIIVAEALAAATQRIAEIENAASHEEEGE